MVGVTPKMSDQLSFLAPNESQGFESLRFRPSPDNEGLPFPLYLDTRWKFLITAGLSLALVYGIRLRLVIVSYLRLAVVGLGLASVFILLWVVLSNSLISMNQQQR